MVSLHNYEWDEELLSLSFWQLIWILLCMMVGGGVIFASNSNKRHLHIIFLKSIGVLVGIYLIAIGLKAIVDQHIVVKYLHFGGYEAVIQGFVFIILGVAFGLYFILLKPPKSADNDRVHSDAPEGGA